MELMKCILGRLGCNIMKIGCMLRMRYNIIANKGAKLRVQSSFFYSKAVDPFFSGVAVLGSGRFSFLMVR